MLIRNAELEGGQRADVRIAGARISAIGQLRPEPGECCIAAGGRLLLPGLHDHHIHLPALAASHASIPCGPPIVTNDVDLVSALAIAGDGWVRGIGYHESVAGMLDAAMLDRMAPDRPVRIQHRGGRMWFLNSMALDHLLARRAAPPGLEQVGGRFTGRLFDDDAWLTEALASAPPSLAAVGALLARRGVTGLTEMTPRNDGAMAAFYAAEQARGALPQGLLVAGRPSLRESDMGVHMRRGPVKLHLHEAALPTFDDLVAQIGAAHEEGRGVAVHCVTEVELVFTLAAIGTAGAHPGDRIEHAGVAPDESVDEIARLGLAVVSQPHFISERGDAYLADTEPRQHPLLYRLRAFRAAGVALAAGSDAPFGRPDPWASMAAAVSRRTRDGQIIGAEEALSAEEALDLYLRDPVDLRARRCVSPGAVADLCLIDRDWAAARRNLAGVNALATFVQGVMIFDAIDQAPTERRLRVNASA
ncbi:hydrolase [Sphingobium sp. C100]|uniref:amidohydrolase family protein n=1 Tax=Sphingobium sp. C100 TaxID=1207055 RepID=UPI0003D5FB3A|nr:amidohydrolase family protein [Sphingobium sp. C100]ETI61166.1 hydrolase [Sphingobium sp. C100]